MQQKYLVQVQSRHAGFGGRRSESGVNCDRTSQRTESERRVGLARLTRRRRASAGVSRMPANAATGSRGRTAAEQDSAALRHERPGKSKNIDRRRFMPRKAR